MLTPEYKSSDRDLSVIIPVYNRVKELERCLSGLHHQLHDLDAEVIVIDDASSQLGIPEVANRHSASYIRLDQPHGSGYCKNLGISVSRGRALLFLDTDIDFVRNTSIKSTYAALWQLPECGEVGGEALVDSEGAIRYIFGRNIDYQTGRSRNDYTPIESYTGPIQYDYVPTSNCMVKRDDALLVNGFDDAYSILGEDKDFGYRLKLMGLKNYVVENSVVLHWFAPHGRRVDGLNKLNRTQVRFFIRHFGFRSFMAMLFRQELDILSALFQRSPNTVPVDPIIAALEDHFVQTILRINTREINKKDVLRNALRFLGASFWNLTHRDGLRAIGGSKYPLRRGDLAQY